MSSTRPRRKNAQSDAQPKEGLGQSSASSLSVNPDPSAGTTPSKNGSSATSKKNKSDLRLPLLQRAVSFKDGSTLDPTVVVNSRGGMKLSAPSTPWHEMDLSDSFLHALHNPPIEPAKTFWKKRRVFLVIGALVGIVFGWLFTEGDALTALQSFDPDSFNFDMQSIIAEFPSLGLNVSEFLAPGREWLNSKATNFEVGREAKERGLSKHHAAIIIPGVISSGLESWSTTPDSASFFRKRIWASTAMLRAIVSNKEAWVNAMSLDPDTGLDPPGYKVRAAQGLDAATSFLPGYWIWQRVIENLAVIDYDHNDLQLFSYDWRLSYYNLEERDRYFSRLKSTIEMSLHTNGKKTVLISHSMGGLVTLWFIKWVEADEFGAGGKDWCEKHLANWINISGTMLGVPKAMSALLSGEMRDTVEINAAGVYLLERYFSRAERAKLFRSWAGASSMMLKGGNAVWGDESGAPDDPDSSSMSGNNIYMFKPAMYDNTTEISAQTMHPNLTIDDATSWLLNHVPPSYQKMMGSNFSFGIERDPDQIAANDDDHSKWANPLEVRLPDAPSMKIFCLYGHGKETERSYFYQQGQYEHDEAPRVDQSLSPEDNSSDVTPRPPLDLPLSQKVWIDSTVNIDSSPQVRSGVMFGEGDGTVSLLSLGGMCVDGWQRELYNPAQIPVITHEIKHDPVAFDPRGGPTTADHVDILGSSELNEAILDIVAGRDDLVKDKLYSRIKHYASRIKWEV